MTAQAMDNPSYVEVPERGNQQRKQMLDIGLNLFQSHP